MRLRTGTLVEVEYDDPTGRIGWSPTGDHREATRCLAVGYVGTGSTGRDLVVLHVVAVEEGQAYSSLTIPAGCIRRIRRLSSGRA